MFFIYAAKNYDPAVQQLATILCCTYLFRTVLLLTTLNNIVHLNNAEQYHVNNCEQQVQQNLVATCFCQRWKNLKIFTRVQYHLYTRKNAQVVTCNKLTSKLQQVCHQTVTRFIRTACSQLLQQVVDKLLSTCNKVDDDCRTCYKFVPTSLLSSGRNKLFQACCQAVISNLSEQTCYRHQPCYKLITTCSRLVNNWEKAAANTSC